MVSLSRATNAAVVLNLDGQLVDYKLRATIPPVWSGLTICAEGANESKLTLIARGNAPRSISFQAAVGAVPLGSDN